jgi:glutathione synthase/RimK-type ligase-like ATP-grasp enzyme
LKNKKIALATSAFLPQGSKDTPLLLKSLQQGGYQAEIVVWNDNAVDWESFDVVFLHTVWDYILHIDDFRDWINRITDNVSFINDADLILWNSDKRYLFDLQAKGVKLPDTAAYEKGSELITNKEISYPIVVKKVVSAGGRGNWLCHDHTALIDVIREQNLLEETILIQNYEPSILTNGEYSSVFFGGEFQHVIHKLPQQGEYRVQSQYGGTERQVQLTPEMLDFNKHVLQALPMHAEYARIDFIQDGAGIYKLMEVELIEPDLFMRYHPLSFGHFVSLI